MELPPTTAPAAHAHPGKKVSATAKSSNDLLDLNKLDVDEKNLQMFRKKHLFVEMHELNDKEWHETKRWNYGLEEDLQTPGGKWGSAHLPTISVFGMMGFRECLKPELILLDAVEAPDETHQCPNAEWAAFNRCLRAVAMSIVNHFVRDGQISPGDAAAALDALWGHLSLKKCVDHDDILKEAKAEFEKAVTAAAAQPPKPRPSLKTDGGTREEVLFEPAPESATLSRRAFKKSSLARVPSMARLTNLVVRAGHLVTQQKEERSDDDEHQQQTEDFSEEEEEAAAKASSEEEELSEEDAAETRSYRRRNAKTGGRTDAGRPQRTKVPPPRSISEGDKGDVHPRKIKRRRSSGTLQRLLSQKVMFQARRASSVPALFAAKKQVVVALPPVLPEDPLKPDAEEEAVHILIDDQFDYLKTDAVVVVRLAVPVASGLEERTHLDELGRQESKATEEQSTAAETTTAETTTTAEEDNGHSSSSKAAPHTPPQQQQRQRDQTYDGENGDETAREKTTTTPPKRPQDLLARFIVLVLGPKIDDEALTTVSKQLCERRHAEMGAAAAALMQDDAVVRAMYESSSPAALLDAIDLKLSSMRILPRTSRPTKKAVKTRASRMYQQLAQLKRVAEEHALARAKEVNNQRDPDVVELTNTGGRFVRLEYPDQGAKWGARERDTFIEGFSIGAVLSFAQKYALPLLSGIVLALILANTRAGGYRRWAGVSEHDDDEDDDHPPLDDAFSTRRLSGGGGSSGPGHPTLFGLTVDGHDVTLHFIVNDVLMSLFFGLAVKEIAEAFQPGGSLYPPTRKAVNPMMGTIGGVVGPICLYFVLCAVFVSAGWVGSYDYMQLARGWGIPTATDISIAWVTAVVLFGSGHPAINYLLLCAVIDDGIGLIIIALAYPDAENPLNPVWLLLVVLAMVIAYVLRKLECARWPAYVFLAGPFAWFGLLYAAVHPSLALCFVVPFMPIKIDSAIDDLAERVTLMGDSSHGDADPLDSSVRVKHHHASPLHDFESAVKNFVDFFVLFAFGAVNAGVSFDDAGAFSIVIVLSLFSGKTLGMTIGSSLAVALGFPRPEGMTFRHLVVAGVISSVGLTVSLFIAGEAFATKDQLEGQAKLGALLSVGPALVLVALANVSPKFKATVKGGNGAADKKEPGSFRANALLFTPGAPEDDDEPKLEVATGLAGDGIPVSPPAHKDHEFKETDDIDYTRDYHDDADAEEFLEDAVVSNIEATLREIHRIEAQVEKRAGVRRSSSMIEGFRQAHHDPHHHHHHQ